MNRRRKKKIHIVHAGAIILVSLFFSFWLIFSAIPQNATADNTENLKSIIEEKDVEAQKELSVPSVVLEIEDFEEEVVEIKDEKDATIKSFELSILPKGKHQKIDNEITIISSVELDPQSFKNSFTIVPNISGKFVFNKKIIVYKPDFDFAPGTKYSIFINKNLKSKSGEILGKDINQTFETKHITKILNIPYYRQQFSRSCEAASLRMALAYKGTYTQDFEIVKLAGYAPREPNWAQRIWDDPYEMFVGYIDGPKVGYGMYASALKKSAVALGHEAEVLINPEIQNIAREVTNGNVVIFWGYINNTIPRLSYFYTPENKKVPIYSNEHARVITGVVGNEENPIGFYVHDPLSGKANEYWTKEKLTKHMSIMGAVSNQALVLKDKITQSE